MLISGSPAYYSLIGAGVNWYEAVGDCEILLDGTRELVFTVSDMEGKRKEKYSMQLPGLPERPPKATRLHIHLEFESDKRCRIHVTDLGLGRNVSCFGNGVGGDDSVRQELSAGTRRTGPSGRKGCAVWF